MFHDSTSVLPPVVRHAAHPAVSVWREIALALALSKHGGAWLSDVAYPGLESGHACVALLATAHLPISTRRDGRPAPLTAANMDAAAFRPAYRIHVIPRGLHECDESAVVLPKCRAPYDPVERENIWKI